MSEASQAAHEAASAATEAADAAHAAASESAAAEGAVEAAADAVEAAENAAEAIAMAALNTELGRLVAACQEEFRSWRNDHDRTHQSQADALSELSGRVAAMQEKLDNPPQVTVATTTVEAPQSLTPAPSPETTETVTTVTPAASAVVAPVVPETPKKPRRLLI